MKNLTCQLISNNNHLKRFFLTGIIGFTFCFSPEISVGCQYAPTAKLTCYPTEEQQVWGGNAATFSCCNPGATTCPATCDPEDLSCVTSGDAANIQTNSVVPQEVCGGASITFTFDVCNFDTVANGSCSVGFNTADVAGPNSNCFKPTAHGCTATGDSCSYTYENKCGNSASIAPSVFSLAYTYTGA